MQRLLTIALILTFTTTLPADEPTTQPATTKAEKRKALEREFQQMLENSILKGTWAMTGPEGLAGKAPLSEAREDKYTVAKVSKAGDDYWIVNARVQYADKDVTIPITVRVVWAGDTPVITLDKLSMPGLGTYSARVMIYRGFYCGTWFGANYGGIMSGQILKDESVAEKDRPAPVLPKQPNTAPTKKD
ncbi:MAG: hypothetical protein HZA51_00635 [Planctomycetes bacterium]|nr:hypothetical protein [Planctomycetota bacterium]